MLTAARCTFTAPATASASIGTLALNTSKPCGDPLPHTQHRINEGVVLDLVSNMLRAIVDYARENWAKFIKMAQEALTVEMSKLEKAVSGYEQSWKSAMKFIALVDKYDSFEKLTAMLNKFVGRIMVHKRDRKGNIDTVQEVEIYFNFMGHYILLH